MWICYGQDLDSPSSVINQQQHFRGLVHLRDVIEANISHLKMALLGPPAVGGVSLIKTAKIPSDLCKSLVQKQAVV